MPEKVKDALDFIWKYAPDLSDWVSLKKELLKTLDHKSRGLLSKKARTDKVAEINALEREIICYWESLTNKTLILNS